jgi:anti-anti-sigma factor
MESTRPASSPARVTIIQRIPVVEVIGRLDHIAAPLIDAQTASLFVVRYERVLLDFSAVTYISSAGLRSVLKIIKLATAGGGRVGVFSIPPRVMEIMEISGFLTLVDIYPEREAALKECAIS